MAENLGQITPTISKESGSSERRSQTEEQKLALLAKLALHYWRPDFTATQAKQIYGDYLEDLASVSIYEMQQACADWRQSGERFFPTSGQLMEKRHQQAQASIADRRAAAPPFRGYPALEYQSPKKLKPWRQILHDHGLDYPKGSGIDPLKIPYDDKNPLDALQPQK